MKNNFGFTLIELLVVIGVITILLSIILIAINPARQFGQASDLSMKAAVYDIDNAAGIYIAIEKAYPWEKNTQCRDELEAGGEYSSMGACIQAMTGFDEDELPNYQKNKYKKIHASKCKDQAVMCYIPPTKEIIEDAVYDKWGVVKPGCPGNGENDDCYWCKRIKIDEECEGPTATPSATLTPTPTITPTPTPTQSPTFYMGYCGVVHNPLWLPFGNYLTAPEVDFSYALLKIIDYYPVEEYSSDVLIPFLHDNEYLCTETIMQSLENTYCSDSENPRDFNRWFIAAHGHNGFGAGRTEWGETGHIRKYCP